MVRSESHVCMCNRLCMCCAPVRDPCLTHCLSVSVSASVWARVVPPSSEQRDEVLLQENPSRFVLFPIKYPAIWEMYKKHQAAFWTAEEIDLQADHKDWATLSQDEQHFIKVRQHAS